MWSLPFQPGTDSNDGQGAPCRFESEFLVGGRVKPLDPEPGLQGGQLAEVVGVEFEVEQRQVLSQPVGGGGLGHDGDAPLDVPVSSSCRAVPRNIMGR